MAQFARDEIMSSSEVVHNFGSVMNSVVQHRREKIAIVRNNRLEAVLIAADLYDRLETAAKTAETPAGETHGRQGDSKQLLDF